MAMPQPRPLPQDSRDLRQMARQAREARGMLPRELATAAGVSPSDVEFVEAHGVAPTASMLGVLAELGIADHPSEEFARLARLIPGGVGEDLTMELVQRGFKTVEESEAAAESALQGLPWLDLGRLSLLREGLRLYRAGEATGDMDES